MRQLTIRRRFSPDPERVAAALLALLLTTPAARPEKDAADRPAPQQLAAEWRQ